MPFWAKRASHIDPPASSDAIMRKACSYRGENHGPGKDPHRELELRPGTRERPRSHQDQSPVIIEGKPGARSVSQLATIGSRETICQDSPVWPSASGLAE